ncbi:hypothetical protein SY88_22320 [Clostridiales bacterium PH28_bin88]|nr:hypothetical protein SY88_22320 [Clostridiales bacterium PH28_bin88]
MQFLITIIIAWVLFSLVVAAIPLRMEVEYRKHADDDRLTMVLRAWPGVWGYKLEVPVIQWNWEDWLPYLRMEAATETSTGQSLTKHEVKVKKVPPLPLGIVTKISGLFKAGLDILRINRWFYRNIRCHRLKWVTEVGLEDAAATGMFIGGLWVLKGWVFANLQRTVKVEFSRPEFEVIPSFAETKLNLGFNCIFAIRAGHIMLMGLRTFWILIKAVVGQRG